MCTLNILSGRHHLIWVSSYAHDLRLQAQVSSLLLDVEWLSKCTLLEEMTARRNEGVGDIFLLVFTHCLKTRGI